MINEEQENFQKPEHPQKNANWLSIITFAYTIPIFRKGYRKDFDENDLTKPLEDNNSSYLGHEMAIRWSEEVRRVKATEETPHLFNIILKMFLKDICRQGLCLFIMEVPIRLCQPIFLGLLLRYFCPENKHTEYDKTEDGPTYIMRVFTFWKIQTPVSENEAYFFACGIVFCSIINPAVLHPCMLSVMHVGMKIRVACCSLIYRKVLRLDLTSLSGSTVGNVVNLMSNDVNRFDLGILFMHYIWIAPVQMLLSLFLMYNLVGLAAVYGVCTIICLIPLQVWFGNRTSAYRLLTATRTDERVKQMNEIIQGMQVIKMYTWEYAFAKQIDELRRQEMNVLIATSYIRGAIMSFIMFTTRLAVFLTALAIVLRNANITAEKVFVVTSFYQILRHTMTLFFPYAIAQIAETNVAIARIKRFLLTPECSIGDRRVLDPHWVPPSESSQHLEPKIIISNAFVKIDDNLCLQNISLDIGENRLTALIGQVGSGKSSILNLILGEFQPYVGSVEVEGVISYASQEPWLFAGSVRQNILFGRKFEKKRYYRVIKVCALVRDFQLLPYGDETIVGEKGASLSGGQRARINLARAVYKQADIYLLDDPLSAVDANVAKQLFDKCITSFLSDKVVILVTHQLQFLISVNKVVLMHEGKIEAEGSYHFLETRELDFAQFLREQLNVDLEETEEQSQKQEESEDKISNIIKDLQYKSHISLGVIDAEGRRYKPKEVAEIRTKGSVECYIFKEYFKAGGNWCVIFTVAALFCGAQLLASGGDAFVAAWVDLEEKRNVNEDLEDVVLKDLSTNDCIMIYTAIIFLTMVVALTRSFTFFTVCMRASVNLHDRMFRSIITASMHFFTTNTSGRILNRFSKDLGQIDELLPVAMIDCTQISLNLVGAAAIVCYVNIYLGIPTLFICVIFYFLRAFYVKTSRSVKRLEGISRSPVFAHLNASIQGLATIRSEGQEMLLVAEFDRLQDDHSSAWFMFISTSRAFGYWLDFLCAIFIGLVAFSFLIFPSSGGNVGLAITTAIGLTGLFQWGMKQSAELENQMTSVERVLEYTRIEHEPDLESRPDGKPSPDWPNEGRIIFENLEMRYDPDNPPVLKSLNFVIDPKEKIGIVGRTGAGKSSLIAALFRLAEFEGAIFIDNVNTKNMGLHDLRKKISIIPQEPVLFSGTLRYNMDPFQNYNDDAIVNALIAVEIKSALAEGNNCLEQHVREGGVNISVGERQMVCLARAILRNNKILVLDEATANVDPQTDKFIQTTIRSKFSECTVLTIAHRLHTIMDSDRVMVMDAGITVEFDHPHILLGNPVGVFSQMVAKTGSAMSQKLRTIAKMSYELKYGRK